MVTTDGEGLAGGGSQNQNKTKNIIENQEKPRTVGRGGSTMLMTCRQRGFVGDSRSLSGVSSAAFRFRYSWRMVGSHTHL